MHFIAPAKVNLSLQVVGKRDDGYHLLSSLVSFTEVGDSIALSPSDNVSIAVTGEFAEDAGDDADNLCVRAAQALREALGVSKGVHIALEKRMPVGAGLGGGSSDAAAILRHMPVFWDVLCDEAIQTSIAQSLGADVPICLNPEGLWLMEGIGHDIQPLSWQLADAALLLVHPRVPTSTPAVYKAFANVGELSSPECVTDWLAIEDAWAWRAIAGSKNDLQRPAITVSRTIAEVLQELMTALPEPECARMSGSGACCFALYKEKSQADNLASSLRQQHPDWWVAVTNLR